MSARPLAALTALNALAALATALCLATPARAQDRSLALKRFHATVIVNPDATIDVTEAITVQFNGKWNGVYRTIPVDYRTPQGFSWTIQLAPQGATDPEGHALKVDADRTGASLRYRIWVPGAENATKTVIFRYRASNALRFFPDHDELYWNVTGDEWDVPIEVATARIELPARAGNVRAIAFNGAYGSTARDAHVAIDSTTVRVSMPKSLAFHEGMTAVVGWNKGVVTEPTAADNAVVFFTGNWPLGIPVVVFAVMLALWYRVGRDPASLPITVQYEPPGGLTPAEMGALMDESVDMRDITATIVDLAVGGWLKIEEREDSMIFGLITKRDYVFHRLEPKAGARALEPHERRVLDGIFEHGEREVKLSDLENEFYTSLPGIRGGVFERLASRGLQRSRPDRVKGAWAVGGVLFGMATVALSATVAARFNLAPPAIFIGAGIGALIIILFGRIMPARTVAGARTLEQVRGFEEFLRRVEGDRYERVIKTPEMFERFLPYAMAFGVEKKWARAFQDILRDPPTWYVGSNPAGFNASTFSSRLGDMTSRAGSTMSSSPRSSGGSGFSGGSSGGGGGGGGGGGF